MAQLIVAAVKTEGLSKSEAARTYGVSRRWVITLIGRYEAEGDAGLVPRSRRPKSSPNRTPIEVENEIVRIRKTLDRSGHEAGAATIAFHLEQGSGQTPAVSTIWRILSERGFVTPQPHKRPKSSYVRFQAEQPRRSIRESRHRVVRQRSGLHRPLPQTRRVALEVTLNVRGIVFAHSRPYHPQTCGKVERFHQTLKKWLTNQPTAANIAALQAQLDAFADYYNTVRSHRARGRRTPATAYNARPKATPSGAPLDDTAWRVRHDRVDDHGKVTLRHQSHLHHIGVGRAHNRKHVLILVKDLHVRITTSNGEILRDFQLGPTRDYQPQPKP